MRNNFNLDGNFAGMKVNAYDYLTDKKVGTYESVAKAGRALFIRSEPAIKSSAFSGKKGKGVADYKTGRLYYFKETK